MLIEDEHHSSVLTLSRSQDRCAADGARHKARRALRLRPHGRSGRQETCSKRSNRFTSFSIRFAPLRRKSCALPTWWFWRGGCTRSHSEHGRETPQRRWYFVSRRGRVGRCQVCKTQDKTNRSSSLTRPKQTGRQTGLLARKTRRDFGSQNSARFWRAKLG